MLRACFVLLVLTAFVQAVGQMPNTPVCQGLTLSIEPIKIGEGRFRMNIRNDSNAAIVLPPMFSVWWNLARKTPQRWRPDVSGGQTLDRGRLAEISPGQTYGEETQIELWGDEASPHPGGTYRAIISYMEIEHSAALTTPPIREICVIRASPIVFSEPAPNLRP
jgi:hypothetical protein